MRLILAKILWNFDLSLVEQTDGKLWTNQRAHLVWAKGPLMVNLTPVHRSEKGKMG